jgi:hypothetical protein
MSSDGLNIADVFRDNAAYHVVLFLPLLVVCAISRRRRWIFPLGLACTVASWVTMILLLLNRLGGITDAWGAGSPHRPGGTFAYTFTSLFILMFWLVAAVVGGALYAARQRISALGTVLPISAVLVYAMVATWVMHNATLGSTFVAPGFTRKGWTEVAPGQSRADVELLLGRSLPEREQPSFASDRGWECWISNRSWGYFACISFHDRVVVTKQLWYDGD